MKTTFYSKLPAFVVMILLIPGLHSCKKKKNPDPFINTRIATVDEIGGGYSLHTQVYYNQDNKVDSMAVSEVASGSVYSGYRKYIYSGNTCTVTDQDHQSYTVITDGNGLITKVISDGITTMTYSGNELVQMDDNSTYGTTTTKYTWSHGNLSFSGDNTYFFDPKRAGQPGDALRIGDFLVYGKYLIRTNNLPTEIKSTNAFALRLFSYLYDSQGRISRYTSKYADAASLTVYDSLVYVYTYY